MISRVSSERPVRERVTRSTRESSAKASAEARPARRSASTPQARPADERSTVEGAPERQARSFSTLEIPPDLDKAGAILLLAKDLMALVAVENEALKAHRFEALEETLPRKQALSRGYLEQMIAVKKDPSLLTTLPEERRAEVRKVGEALSEAMTENAALIKGNIDAVRLLVGNIVSAMREYKVETAAAYDTDGRLDEAQGDTRTMSFALNKEL